MGKRNFQACLKDDSGILVEELSAPRSMIGAEKLLEALRNHDGNVKAVMEATGNHWICLHDMLEEDGVETILANPVKTRLIAEARIRTDRLDARVLADLLRGSLVAESYTPSLKERDWRSLVRHRASLVRMETEVKNRIHALLDKYWLEPEYSDLFGKRGLEWLRSLRLSEIDQLTLNSNLKLLESLEAQVDALNKEIARIAVDEKAIRLLMTIPGIDYYSAMLITAEIGDVHRFMNAKKLASWAGLVPSIHRSGNTVYMGKITKKGSKWLRWILI